jgi:hypothetical protein
MRTKRFYNFKTTKSQNQKLDFLGRPYLSFVTLLVSSRFLSHYTTYHHCAAASVVAVAKINEKVNEEREGIEDTERERERALTS